MLRPVKILETHFLNKNCHEVSEQEQNVLQVELPLDLLEGPSWCLHICVTQAKEQSLTISHLSAIEPCAKLQAKHINATLNV